MPKVKSHSGAAKRFKVSGSGRIVFKHTNKRHLLRKRSKKRKRSLNVTAVLRNCDYRRLKKVLILKTRIRKAG